jgi:hypothetical protein
VGLVTSGEGRWTFDTTEPIFDLFKEALGGRKLTGETCKTIYDEIYVKQNRLLLQLPPEILLKLQQQNLRKRKSIIKTRKVNVSYKLCWEMIMMM